MAETQVVARMSLEAARNVCLSASLGLKSGGATERFGRILKDEFGLKFDGFKPTDIADILESAEFKPRFKGALEKWSAGLSQDVGESTKAERLRQIRACEKFTADDSHLVLAGAIRTMVERRALQWSERGTNNTFTHSLPNLLHEMVGIRLTMNRHKRLKAEWAD